MAPSNLTDDQLVQQAMKGSPAAYRELVLRYQRPLLGLINRIVRDAALAEDIAQEAFVRAFERLSTFEQGRSFSSWLFKIGHNRAIDHLRRKAHITVPLEAEDPSGEQTWEVLEAPSHESPQVRAEASEIGRVIEEALETLRPSYREVLVLRFQAGLSYQEIADSMGQSLASTKVLLHRARKRLAGELEARGFGPTVQEYGRGKKVAP